MSNPTKIRPAKKLLQASGKCSKEGAAYGQCVLNTYSTIAKDSCEQEYAKFKQCISKQMKGKVW